MPKFFDLSIDIIFDQVVHLIRSYIKPAIGNWIVRNPAERHSFQNRILLKTPHA